MNKQEIIERFSADEDRCKYCNSSTVSGGDIYCSASHSHDMDCDGNDFNIDYKIEEIISALEKQIPKKVTEEKCIHEDWESCNDCENVSNCSLGDKCPCCNNNLDYDCGEEYNYCPDCGQKLDWSVEDE